MIDDLHKHLKEWAEWLESASGPSIPGGNITLHYGHRSGHGKGLVIVRNKNAEAMDLYICELAKALGKHYQRLIMAKYLWKWSDKRIGKELLTCSESTVRIRLQTAHAWLHGRMAKSA